MHFLEAETEFDSLWSWRRFTFWSWNRVSDPDCDADVGFTPSEAENWIRFDFEADVDSLSEVENQILDSD